MNLGDFSPASTPRPAPGERNLVDRWVLAHLADAVDQVTAAFEAHDYMQAHQAASRMFWSIYCDRYIEMIKDRLSGGAGPDNTASGSMVPEFLDRDSPDRDSPDRDSPELDIPDRDSTDRNSVRWTLWESYRMLLGLFAPFAPFVTERMYQQFYRGHENAVSLHLTRWPAVDERWRGDHAAGDQLAVILDATRALRSGLRLGSSARLRQLIVQAHDAQADALLDRIAEPLRIASRADAVVRAPAAHPSGVPGITVAIAVQPNP
jgi:valyl-tRNA synthetase